MKKILSCAQCGSHNCASLDKEFPNFCLTTANEEENLKSLEIYLSDPFVNKVALASAQVEGLFYKQLTRVEEIVEFARRIGAKKIGIACCKGLAEEGRIFQQILVVKGLEGHMALCKMGANDKEVIGIKEEEKINKGAAHESMCNPILQALTLNKIKTDLNVVIGLCVGHDSLFYKYSEAICTTLVTKDRILAHNPAGALYTAKSYNRQLFSK